MHRMSLKVRVCVIQTFYNADILEEDAILNWQSERTTPAHGCKAEDSTAVKAAAKKFVD